MNNLIENAFSIEKDIENMQLVDKLNYAMNLFADMARLQSEPLKIEDVKTVGEALTHLEGVLRVVASEYKDVMLQKLDREISSIPYCSLTNVPRDENEQLVEIILSDIYIAELRYKWDHSLHICFAQVIKERNGSKTKINLTISWKNVPEWIKQIARLENGHFVKDVSYDNWVDETVKMASELRNHAKDFVSLCQVSSNYDEYGKMKVKYKSWKTKGRLLYISKEMPLRHMYHAKKDGQDFWNNSPYVHGSNGTYVENVNPTWTLTIKVKRPSYEVFESIPYDIDIHAFITQTLMPKLGWEIMTPSRLESLNEILSGLAVELETTDTYKAALYRNFLPVGFTNWDEYLEQTLLSKLIM